MLLEVISTPYTSMTESFYNLDAMEGDASLTNIRAALVNNKNRRQSEQHTHAYARAAYFPVFPSQLTKSCDDLADTAYTQRMRDSYCFSAGRLHEQRLKQRT